MKRRTPGQRAWALSRLRRRPLCPPELKVPTRRRPARPTGGSPQLVETEERGSFRVRHIADTPSLFGRGCTRRCPLREGGGPYFGSGL